MVLRFHIANGSDFGHGLFPERIRIIPSRDGGSRNCPVLASEIANRFAYFYSRDAKASVAFKKNRSDFAVVRLYDADA